jgi:hypothetical protein
MHLSFWVRALRSLRAERGNLMPIPEIASAAFISLAMTERGVFLSLRSETHSPAHTRRL